MDRVIWIILDSVGIGSLPDASLFGDEGCNTLKHVWEKAGGLAIPNMIKLGIANIDGVDLIDNPPLPVGSYGRCKEISDGKDTTTGHWEMTGIHVKEAFPTYPAGFPDYIIESFLEECRAGGFKFDGILGNCTASGTEIIKELGDEHIATGKPIVYTSADSVFQIACHEDVYSPEELYKMCAAARKILTGKDAAARVIARPFIGSAEEGFARTANRRDFSLLPPDNNLLVRMKRAGMNVAAVGKIEDIFAGAGITGAKHTKDNMDGVDKTLEYMDKIDEGLIFTNLVEFDSKWGHRNDYAGYAKGLEEFDARLPEILSKLRENDLLIINADHGCDPTTAGTDHTREYIPLLVYGKKMKNPVNLGTLETFADIGQTIAEIFGIEKLETGTGFLNKII